MKENIQFDLLRFQDQHFWLPVPLRHCPHWVAPRSTWLGNTDPSCHLAVEQTPHHHHHPSSQENPTRQTPNRSRCNKWAGQEEGQQFLVSSAEGEGDEAKVSSVAVSAKHLALSSPLPVLGTALPRPTGKLLYLGCLWPFPFKKDG